MDLVKDINPYDKDSNSLPSAEILFSGVFHTRSQRLLVKMWSRRYFLTPRDSCLLKCARQCTLQDETTSGTMPASPALSWSRKGERGMKEDGEREAELGRLNHLSFQYRARAKLACSML